MKVVVINKPFGTYQVGEELEMIESTALACIKSGVVEAADGEREAKSKKKKKDETD